MISLFSNPNGSEKDPGMHMGQKDQILHVADVTSPDKTLKHVWQGKQ
jgi:hypothetical protein